MIEDRIRCVLSPMGLNQKPFGIQKDIVDFVSNDIINGNNAFNLSDLDEHSKESRMFLSKMLNDYVIKFDSRKTVKVRIFLSELQLIILFENEIIHVLV